jgi:hypothetical protein
MEQYCRNFKLKIRKKTCIAHPTDIVEKKGTVTNIELNTENTAEIRWTKLIGL